MNYAALVSFNHVAAAGGFGQASRATGQAKATLSRHVRELEEELGVRLVERGARTLRLTDEGMTLRLRTEGLLAEVENAAQDIAARCPRPRGRLRVSAPVLFAHIAIGRIAAEFAARYPEIELEVLADDRNVDLVAEGYDAVIRVDPQPEPKLVGRCFLRDHHVIVAPPSLARPDLDDGASKHEIPAVVLSDGTQTSPWSLSDAHRSDTLYPRPVMRVSTLLMARDAVLAGVGAARLPSSLVADDLAAGRLVSLGSVSGRSVELWVMHTSRRLVSPKVEVLVGYLCAAFAGN